MSEGGYIYFVLDKNRIKIGHSKDPYKRLKQIKTFVPDAKLFYTAYNDSPFKMYEAEKMIQYIFYGSHIDREWFKFNKELKENLNLIKKNGLNRFIFNYLDFIKIQFPKRYDLFWTKRKIGLVKLFEVLALVAIYANDIRRKEKNVNKQN